MFRGILRAAPLSAGLAWAFWYNGLPVAWAAALAVLTTPTIWLVQVVKKEISPR